MRTLAFRNNLRREAARCTGIRRHAARLRLGEITRDQFLRETAQDWRNLAQHLYNAYKDKLPPSLSIEDLAQEMRSEALRVLPAWDPGGRSIGDYLIYNGCSKARKVLNRERQAEKRDGKAPSRFPIPAACLVRRDGDGKDRPTPFDRLASDANQEDVLAGRELYEELRRELGRGALRVLRDLGDGGAAAKKKAERAIASSPRLAAALERIRRGETEL